MEEIYLSKVLVSVMMEARNYIGYREVMFWRLRRLSLLFVLEYSVDQIKYTRTYSDGIKNNITGHGGCTRHRSSVLSQGMMLCIRTCLKAILHTIGRKDMRPPRSVDKAKYGISIL